MRSPTRRTVGGVILLTVLALSAGASAFVRRTPETSISWTRSRYRRYLAQHGATVVSADSTALQRTLNDCGIAVVHEALRTLGIANIPSHDSLARATNLTAAGTTLSALARTARNAGLRTIDHDRTGRVLGEHLLIAHFSIGHFVLVRGSGDGRVRFFDPMVGEVVAPAAVFDALWSGGGFTLLLDDTASPGTRPSTPTPIARERDTLSLF